MEAEGLLLELQVACSNGGDLVVVLLIWCLILLVLISSEPCASAILLLKMSQFTTSFPRCHLACMYLTREKDILAFFLSPTARVFGA